MTQRLDLGYYVGDAVVGRHGWLLWKTLNHLEVRIGLRPVADSAFFDVSALWIEDLLGHARRDRSAHEAITSSDLRELPIRSLQKVLLAPEFTEAILNAWADKAAPVLDPRKTSTPASRDWPSLEVLSLPEVDLGLAGGADRSNDFYEDVLTAYARAVGGTDSAAASSLAEETGVPVTTINGWIKEAKRRRIAHLFRLDVIDRLSTPGN